MRIRRNDHSAFLVNVSESTMYSFILQTKNNSEPYHFLNESQGVPDRYFVFEKLNLE